MRQLFVPRLPAPGSLLEIDGEERHYLGRVLRARPGEELRLAAEDGSAARAVLESFQGESASLRVGAADPDPARPLDLGLELCPPRGEALDQALELAVQLGVARVRLLRSERTLAVPGEGALKRERLERRLREACRQCLRAAVPALEEPWPLGRALALGVPEGEGAPSGPLRLMLSERGGEPLPVLRSEGGAAPRVRVLVGPEGGFTSEEFSLARAAGWRLTSLGPLVLKVPTAVAAALAGLAALNAAA